MCNIITWVNIYVLIYIRHLFPREKSSSIYVSCTKPTLVYHGHYAAYCSESDVAASGLPQAIYLFFTLIVCGKGYCSLVFLMAAFICKKKAPSRDMVVVGPVSVRDVDVTNTASVFRIS